MTFAAESALRHLAHFHFIRALDHLEYMVMAIPALHTFPDYVLFMTEQHRFDPRIFRPEDDVAPPDGLRCGCQHHA